MAQRVTPNTEFLRILFTGRSGSTKTRSAYSATLDPRTQPVLGLDCGGQPRSIVDYRPRPDLIRLESLADVTEVYRWLARGQPNDSYAKKFELNPPYKTLVPDGFSEMQRWIALGAAGNSSREPGERLSQVEIQHYGTILGQTLLIVEKFYALPMHVIGTVLEQERQEGENGPILNRHQLVGQARDQVSSYPEIVGRLVHVDKLTPKQRAPFESAQLINTDTVAVCYFKPSLRWEAKDQTGALGDAMVDVTITKILDAIEAHARETRD